MSWEAQGHSGIASKCKFAINLLCIESLLQPGSPLSAALNHRQRALLLHAIRHSDSLFEIAAHQASHRVTYPTARADLLGLVTLGLLSKRKAGKAFVFKPAADLAKRLER